MIVGASSQWRASVCAACRSPLAVETVAVYCPACVPFVTGCRLSCRSIMREIRAALQPRKQQQHRAHSFSLYRGALLRVMASCKFDINRAI